MSASLPHSAPTLQHISPHVRSSGPRRTVLAPGDRRFWKRVRGAVGRGGARACNWRVRACRRARCTRRLQDRRSACTRSCSGWCGDRPRWSSSAADRHRSAAVEQRRRQRGRDQQQHARDEQQGDDELDLRARPCAASSWMRRRRARRAPSAWAASVSASGAPWRAARSSAATSCSVSGSGSRSVVPASDVGERDAERGLAARRGATRRPAGRGRGGRPRPARPPAAGPASTVTRSRSSSAGSSRSACSARLRARLASQRSGARKPATGPAAATAMPSRPGASAPSVAPANAPASGGGELRGHQLARRQPAGMARRPRAARAGRAAA